MDEAHHASSSGYAYAHIVRLLEEGGARYRLLGLSATAGTDLPQVQRVVRALRIERIEVRRETDCELEPHSHAREVRIVRAPQGTFVVVAYTIAAAGLVAYRQWLTRRAHELVRAERARERGSQIT